MIRRSPLRRSSVVKKSVVKRKKNVVKRPRRWQCKYDGYLNEAGARKCAGRCQSRRDKRASSFEAEARRLHIEYVRPAGRPCFFCGGLVDVQDAHILGKGANPNPAVKWHPDNGLPACGAGGKNCHRKYDSYQLGDRGEIAVRFMGRERYAELCAAATKRWDRAWPDVIQRLKDALAERKAA